MKQVTLIAHYGQKPRVFENYVGRCWQHILQSPLRRFFSPYHMNQVHGTIIGMEKLIGYSEPFNANLWRESGERKVMGFAKLLQIAREDIRFRIRFGGFTPHDTSIDSFGKTPYVRSIQFQWAQRKVTIMGWHHEEGDFSRYTELWKLRKRIEDDCNVKHRYSNDNDFFMVIGELVNLESLSDEELSQLKQEGERLEQTVREELATDPKLKIDLEIDSGTIFVTQYKEETLALSSTRAYCVVQTNLDADFILGLYDS
jgi:hypothetical protein